MTTNVNSSANLRADLSTKRGYNLFLLLVAGLGGLLYGIDVGIIGGALPYLEATSHLTAAELSVTRLTAGKVSIYNDSAKPLDLTADVVGYYGRGSSAGTFLPVSPVRILDTRSGLGGRTRAR